MKDLGIEGIFGSAEKVLLQRTKPGQRHNFTLQVYAMMLMERQLAKQDPKKSADSVALPMHASIRKPEG
jgi:hypothetical protein